jgi:hypothetical protein
MYQDPFLPAAGTGHHLPTIGHLIDGKLVAGGSRSQDVFNPATGRAEKRVLLADAETIEQAIASAQAAYPAWRATPPLKRARVMGKLKQLLEEHADQICALLTAEHGKVVGDALGELQRGIENVEFASYAPELLKGEHSRNVGPAIDSWSEFQALGCHGRHHAVQLPGHGAAVDVADGRGLRQHLHPQALRARPVQRAAGGPAGAGSRPAARRAQRRQRRQGGGRRDC